MLDAETALRRAERERAARKIAERLLEEKSTALFLANEQLEKSRANLERRVLQRTEELAVATELLRNAAEQSHLASKAKSDFLARMSHEIRTPMNGIVGLTELLLQTPLKRGQREYLRMIQSSADNLLEIINDILDFSRIEAGKMELSATEFRLRDLILEVSRTFALRAEQKGLDFVLTISPDVPFVVNGDPQRLSQILINLLGNSIKFTRLGQIGLDVSVEQIIDETSDIRFVVSDTGIGIPHEKQELIFQPFDQADGTTSRNFGGSGLGLSISKQIAEMMGGSISVSSVENEGSEFTTRLKIHVVRRFESPDIKSLSHLRGKHCLVVESSPRQQTMMRSLLEEWRCKCTTASSALEGKLSIHEARHNTPPFDIAFISTRLSDGSGESVVSALRHLGIDIPVVLMRSLSEAQPMGDHSSAGLPRDAEHSIARPFLSDELLAVAYRAISGEAQRPVAGDGAQIRSETVPVSRTYRILLVDDMPVNRAVAHGMLTKFGHVVQCAENGLEALRWIQQSAFDVVFLDIQMPEMDGLTAASIIRQLEEESQSRVPLIALTANAFANDRERYLAAGFDDYLSKPFVLQELLKIVERWGVEQFGTKTEEQSQSPNADCPVQESFADAEAQPFSEQPFLEQPLTDQRHGVDRTPSLAVGNEIQQSFDSEFLMRQVSRNLDLLERIIGIYETSLNERTEILHTAVSTADSATIESVSHALKGTFGSLGGIKAADSARILEAAVKLKQTSEWKPLVDTLLDDAETLRHQLIAFLETQRSPLAAT